VDILSCLQTQNNFQEILSTTNDYSQTLAHLSIFYGYHSLLRHLVEWGIDLAISDINGLTALHCAFMKGDLDSVRILRRGGASETVTDKLGRTPSDLQYEGFSLAIDLDAEVAAGMDNDIDEQMALGEQLNNLGSSDDKDSGYSQSDSSEGPFVRIRRGKSTTVESPSPPPRRISIAGTRLVRSVVLELSEEDEVPVDVDYSSPPQPPRVSAIRTTPSIPPPKAPSVRRKRRRRETPSEEQLSFTGSPHDLSPTAEALGRQRPRTMSSDPDPDPLYESDGDEEFVEGEVEVEVEELEEGSGGEEEDSVGLLGSKSPSPRGSFAAIRQRASSISG